MHVQRDISDAVTAGGFTVNRNMIVLDKPIKTLGVHATKVQLHPEVLVNVKLNVARSADEAERQSRGENVTMVKDEVMEIETYKPDDMFDEGGDRQEAGGEA